MRIKVLYFAKLREKFGVESEEIELPGDRAYAAAIIDLLRRRGEPWARELGLDAGYRMAVNQTLAGLVTPVRDGDEVAIFPPVTGG
ncbi:MAG: molybdopterin converting factor subunit 1 [Hydrogenophilaceae bacterium]|nr:molybdopterin converting factor subunit 1 [Hydrogenophilaceae bacterium]